MLGTAGKVGYDTAEAAFFHRELPYAPGRVMAMNPRLREARALVDRGMVALTEPGVAVVRVGDHTHQVRYGERDGNVASCTCLWWTEYRGDRAPCRHVIAVRLARGEAARR